MRKTLTNNCPFIGASQLCTISTSCLDVVARLHGVFGVREDLVNVGVENDIVDAGCGIHKTLRRPDSALLGIKKVVKIVIRGVQSTSKAKPGLVPEGKEIYRQGINIPFQYDSISRKASWITTWPLLATNLLGSMMAFNILQCQRWHCEHFPTRRNNIAL